MNVDTIDIIYTDTLLIPWLIFYILKNKTTDFLLTIISELLIFFKKKNVSLNITLNLLILDSVNIHTVSKIL